MAREQTNMDDVRAVLSEKIQAAGCLNEITLKFKLADTDESRVLTTLEIFETFAMIPEAKCKLKDSDLSIQIRNEANKMFASAKKKVDDYIKVWKLYSKSIATAPNESQELSAAYANRSAVLMKLKKYEECLKDIDRALSLNKSSHLIGKLLLRRMECFISLDRSDHAQKTIDEVTEWLDEIDLAEDEKEKIKTKLHTSEKSADTNPFGKMSKKKNIPSIVTTKEYPSASEALAVKYNENFGRHVVADRAIEPGEILVVEKHYSKLLAPGARYSHCSHCLQFYWTLVPCKFCIDSMYCSEDCKNEAWKEYHDIECTITGYLLDLNFNKSSLFSLRLAILAVRKAGSINKLRNDLSKVEDYKDPCRRGFDEDGVYSSDKYISLYTLVTNTEKRTTADLFERATNTAYILYYLSTGSNFFEKKYVDLQGMYTDKDVMFVGGLIMRHSQIIPSNIHSFEEIRDYESVDIGAAALPFCSLINHSCDPNVSRCTTKDYMIIFAVLPIKKGSQIFDNYGGHYAVMTKQERQRKLNQYFFQCECIACVQDWPTYENTLSFSEILEDKGKIEIVDKALSKLKFYIDCAKGVNVNDEPHLLEYLSEIITILMDNVPMPCHEVNDVVETLKRVVALQYGNEFEIPNL